MWEELLSFDEKRMAGIIIEDNILVKNRYGDPNIAATKREILQADIIIENGRITKNKFNPINCHMCEVYREVIRQMVNNPGGFVDELKPNEDFIRWRKSFIKVLNATLIDRGYSPIDFEEETFPI